MTPLHMRGVSPDFRVPGLSNTKSVRTGKNVAPVGADQSQGILQPEPRGNTPNRCGEEDILRFFVQR